MPRRWLLLALLGAVVPSGAVCAPVELPIPVCSAMEPCRMVGKGSLRWWGLHVYDAALWAREGRWNPEAPYALDIVYSREISGMRLADTTLEEMRRLGSVDEARLARWRTDMQAIFPDVQPGSRLIAVFRPQRGVQFHSGIRMLGSIDDPDFARRFFDIWLGPRTQKPALRAELMGADVITR